MTRSLQPRNLQWITEETHMGIYDKARKKTRMTNIVNHKVSKVSRTATVLVWSKSARMTYNTLKLIRGQKTKAKKKLNK